MAPRFAPRRPLGRTGFLASTLGAGDLADRTLPRETCVATLRRALDAGLNVVDTAPMYEDGLSEELVGAALRGRRAGVLLVDKIDHLDRPVAAQLDGSLGRLDLPSVDVLVFHAVPDVAAWSRLAARGGGMAELGEEIARGRARFRGISCHDPEVLDLALVSGLCDVVMFPVGPLCDPRYVLEILPRARALGVGTIGFKAFGAGKLVADTEGYGRPARGADLPRLSIEECVRYTLTCDPDVALLGLSSPGEQDAAFAAAEAFRPMSSAEMAETRRRAVLAAQGKGRIWWNPTPAAPG
jgi:aryl-alcohol dehydrogenase-like predicted oxidoreductase